ncbi:MAG: hypothetical protein ACYC9M_01855 [Desulfobulbaceae bacterium]
MSDPEQRLPDGRWRQGCPDRDFLKPQGARGYPQGRHGFEKNYSRKTPFWQKREGMVLQACSLLLEFVCREMVD